MLPPGTPSACTRSSFRRQTLTLGSIGGAPETESSNSVPRPRAPAPGHAHLAVNPQIFASTRSLSVPHRLTPCLSSQEKDFTFSTPRRDYEAPGASEISTWRTSDAKRCATHDYLVRDFVCDGRASASALLYFSAPIASNCPPRPGLRVAPLRFGAADR